jgi:predicted enzyme related to lactoylglutathione lyase
MSTIVHFDVPAENINRAKNFYEKLFNWKIEPVPGPMEYFNISTMDDKGNLSVGGGMGKRGQPNQKITNYIGVDSIEDYLKKVEDLGGKIIMPKTTIPGFGYLATFLDTENNILGLWETDESAKI